MIASDRRRSLSGMAVAMLFGSVLAAGGCAFLLDTDELKEGTGASTGGTGGVAGAAGGGGVAGTGGSAGLAGTGGTAGAAGGTPCDPDDPLACIESPDDPCTKDWCENGFCRRIDHVGEGLIAESEIVDVLGNQEAIGPPALVTDTEANFYLGFWHKASGTAPGEIEIRKHPANPNASTMRKTLPEIFSDVTAMHSSPALFADGTRLSIAAAITADDGPGMQVMEADFDLTKPALSTDPTMLDPDTTYGGFPSQTAPQIGLRGLQRVAIWPFQGDIRMRGWSQLGTAEVYDFGTTTQAMNLVPLSGPSSQAFGAVVEATISGSEALMVWSEGEDSLSTQFDSNPGDRLGLAVAPIEGKTAVESVMSLVGWSRVNDGGAAEFKLGVAGCDPAECGAETFNDPGITATSGTRPAMSVRKEYSSANLRRVALAYAIHERSEPNQASTALVLTLFRLDLDQPDLEVPFEELPYNPPVVLVTDLVGSPDDPRLSPFRHTAIAVHPGGKVMVAWVHQPEGQLATLRYRRYRLQACQ